MTQQIQAPYESPAGQPAGVTPPAAKPFYKKAWFLVLAAVVVVGIIISQTSGGGSGSSSPSTGDSAADGAATAPVEDAAAGIGQPAADGKFEFVVNGVDCSVTTIGNEYVGTTAQGTFCVVDLTVTNIGNEPQSFFGENATLFNAEGQEFSADTGAAIYLENSSSLYEEINPGNTLTSKVVFDVPVGTTPTAIELHDSIMSGGVTVSLQ